MAKFSKRVRAFKEKIEPGKAYPLEEAVSLLKEFATVKFNETVEVAVNLGIDARKSDQAVRGATTLPHGTGGDVRVAVFTQGEAAEKAKAAGADLVGMEDLAEQIKGGMMDFDVVIASPDAMRVVGQLGQLLGPARPSTVPGNPGSGLSQNLPVFGGWRRLRVAEYSSDPVPIGWVWQQYKIAPPMIFVAFHQRHAFIDIFDVVIALVVVEVVAQHDRDSKRRFDLVLRRRFV